MQPVEWCPYARVARFSGVLTCRVKRDADEYAGRLRKWWRGALGAYDCPRGGALPCGLCSGAQAAERKGGA